MKTRFYLLLFICALMQSCYFADAQIVWLSTKNMDFTDCDREERNVRFFEAVTNTGPFDVIYEQAREQYVIVEGDEEYFDNLHTDVSRGVLEISIDPARYRNVRLRVKVGSPDITRLTMLGSGSLICTSDIEADDLSLKVTGSGDLITKDIKCSSLESSVSGSGDIELKHVEAVDVSVSVGGSGDWSSTHIKADNLSVSLAGSGDIEIARVAIDDTLAASVAGSGDIDISGYANTVRAKMSGSGDISGRLTYDHITKTRSGSGDIDW